MIWYTVGAVIFGILIGAVICRFKKKYVGPPEDLI
jgi:hypothetical protein